MSNISSHTSCSTFNTFGGYILNIRVWLLLSISPTGYSLHDNNKDVNMFIVYP